MTELTKKKPGSIIELDKNIPVGTKLIMLGESCGQSYHNRQYFEPLVRDYVVPYCEAMGAKFFVMLFDDVQGKDLQMRGLANPGNSAERGRDLGTSWYNDNGDLLHDPEVRPHLAFTNLGVPLRWRTLYQPELKPLFEKLCDLSYGLKADSEIFASYVRGTAQKYFEANFVAMAGVKNQPEEALRLSSEFSLDEFAGIGTLNEYADKNGFEDLVEIYPGDDNAALRAIRRNEITKSLAPDKLTKYALFLEIMSRRRFIRAKIRPTDAPFTPERELDFKIQRTVTIGSSQPRISVEPIVRHIEREPIPVRPDADHDLIHLIDKLTQ